MWFPKSMSWWMKQNVANRMKGKGRRRTVSRVSHERLEDRTLLSTFNNANPITIPGTGTSGPADPYPSDINFANPFVTATVVDVNVTFHDLSHTFPNDIDTLLVGPAGQNVELMSDAGGFNDINNVDLTFDDAAAAQLPDEAQIVAGTFQPSNFEGGDSFPAPAPIAVASTLATFNGTDPFGTWSLFVADDLSGDTGSMAGGWTLNVQLGGDVVITAGPDADDGTGDTFDISVTATNQQVRVNGNLIFDEPLSGITSLTVDGSGDNDTMNVLSTAATWDPLESTCRHASLSIL